MSPGDVARQAEESPSSQHLLSTQRDTATRVTAVTAARGPGSHMPGRASSAHVRVQDVGSHLGTGPCGADDR
jgi:hypothetical protein